ncbi:MAG: hypothetical protein IT218_02620 [Ignavibacteria bacterium]|nr:hypothetical protein [Ignavibacteria bacterium]
MGGRIVGWIRVDIESWIDQPCCPWSSR